MSVTNINAERHLGYWTATWTTDDGRSGTVRATSREAVNDKAQRAAEDGR